MASSKDVSLAEVLSTNPDLIDQLALLLDREKRLIANWKHLCRVLKVDPKVVSSLEHYTDFSPTIRLFEHLEVVKPDLTIQQLKQALSDIGRNDLVSLLTRKACFHSELVKEVITSTNVVAPRDGLLDDLALALDVQSKCLANWRKLAQKLGVEQQMLKQLERRSTDSPADKLFEYLRATSPQMKLITLKDALGMMKRNDLLKILQEKNLDDEALLKDIIIPESEILQVLEEKLNFDDVPWAKNWRQLAYNLKIPREFYEEFDGTSRQRKSPTREMMKCLVGQDPGINLTDIVEALGEIKRNDAIQIITQHVPDTVDSFLERRGCSFNNNLMFDSQVNAPPDDTSSIQICKVEGWTSSSFPKQADFRQPGHCGSLPDVRYDLVGRDDVCNQIVTNLMSNKAVEIIAPPGYGKTSLVIETAHRLIAKGNFVAYVNPRGVTCVEDLGSEIIEALGEVPGENTIQETLRRIRSLKAKNVVLIIENLDNLLHLEKNQPLTSPVHRGGECCATMQGNYKRDDFLTFIKEIGKTRAIHLVLTSTETNDFSVFFPTEIIELQPLSKQDSFVLFQERGSSLDDATIEELITICGGIPLVICIVLALLKSSNPQELTSRLSTSKACELIKELSPDFLPIEDRIDKCLQLCVSRLDEDNQDVLVKLSTFPNRFTQEQFLAVFQSMKPDLNLEDCLNSIKYCSLLRFERDSCHYCIHPFIRTFCSTQHKHKEAKSHFIRYYSELVVSLSERFLSRHSRTAVEQYRKEKENIREATAWCEDEHPDLDLELQEYCIDSCNKAAVFLAKVMRKQEFEALFCKFSHHCRYDLDRHSACLTAIGMKIVLSCTCTPQICVRAWCRAKSILSRANEIQLSRNTGDDVTRAQCLSKLGFCLVREGHSGEGFEYLDQAMKLRKKLYEGSNEDKDKVMLAACQNDLAASLMLRQKHLAAIETRRNVVLPVYKAILGNHPFVATTLTGIAKSYHELGDYDKAILLSTQALGIREPLLGRHQETARSYYDLGVALAAKEEYERSLKHLQHAVEIQEEVLDTYEELILTHQAMAVVLKELGRDDEGEREMERAKDCAQKLDSMEIAVQTLRIHEEEGSWQRTDPVRIGSP